MTEPKSVPTPPLVSDEAVRDVLRRELHRSLNVERRFTRHSLAVESGVNQHTIDQLLSLVPEKQRRVTLADALSIACVLGERAVNAMLAPIGFVAKPLEEADALKPMQIVADGMTHFATIAHAASDGRIDHTEERQVTEAADALIATVMPLATVGKRAQ